MLYCWVNPAAPTETDRNSRAGERLAPGLGTFEVGSVAAGYVRHEGLGDTPAPDKDIYEWRADTAPPPAYHRIEGRTDALVGDVMSTSAYVQETVNYVKVSLDELLSAKMVELDSYVTDYRLRPFLSPLAGPKGWMTNDQNARDQRGEAMNALHDQLKDIVIDGESKPYWRRDIYYIVIRDSNGQRLSYPLNETEWGQMVKAAALHQDKMQDSIIDVLNEYDAAYEAQDFDRLAAVDPTEPARWEEVYRGPISTGIKVVTPAQAANFRGT